MYLTCKWFNMFIHRGHPFSTSTQYFGKNWLTPPPNNTHTLLYDPPGHTHTLHAYLFVTKLPLLPFFFKKGIKRRSVLSTRLQLHTVPLILYILAKSSYKSIFLSFFYWCKTSPHNFSLDTYTFVWPLPSLIICKCKRKL